MRAPQRLAGRSGLRVRAGWASTALVLALLAGCAADRPKPTPLEPVSAAIAGRQVWQASVGGVQFALAPTVRDGQVVVAGSDGTVLAIDAASGRELWRGSAGARLSAGVGSDGRRAAVVTADNELVVLDQGSKLWSTRLASRTTTAPLVAGERVFVLGVDRAVHAFDALDGRRLWSYSRPGEALTLAQIGVLAPYKNTLVVGVGALLTGLDPTTGAQRWETALTAPRGTNEVERLNDLVGPVLRVGDAFCARAFQTAVGCIDLQGESRATVRFSRLAGGQQAVGGDAELLFGADASDRVSAWKAGTGELLWSTERLLFRSLSAPLAAGRTVVLGDFDGQVHFLDRADGKTLLRLPTDGSAVVAQPVLAGNTIVVVTAKGGVFGFRPE